MVVLTGPRRAGKTHLLRTLFPRARYVLLEDPDVLARVAADPRAFLDEVGTPVVLDEVQNAPHLLSYVRSRVDAKPRSVGRYLLTGSQDFSLMDGITETLAGRAAILQLLPLSADEHAKVDLLRGGYPEVHLRPSARRTWMRSYVQTYLERDLRAVTAVRDLGTFRRFMGLLATRNGQLLNKTDLAAPLGVSVPTITQWIAALEIAGLVMLVHPYFENLGKRLVKTPKLYFVDTGLLVYLLGIDEPKLLDRSPLVGAVFESFVAAEITKAQLARGRGRELYFFRDQQGLEVDFVVPHAGRLLLLEAKYTKTPLPAMAGPLRTLGAAVKQPVACVVVCRVGAPSGPLGGGVRVVPIDQLGTTLRTASRP